VPTSLSGFGSETPGRAKTANGRALHVVELIYSCHTEGVRFALLSRTKSAARCAINAGMVPLRTVQDILAETHLAGVRFRRRISPGTRAKERALMQMNDVELHFGCGPRILSGWVNIDGWQFPSRSCSMTHHVALYLPSMFGTY
jgi:hypothetical protein